MTSASMYTQRLRVVKPGRRTDTYSPTSPGRLTLDLNEGATITPGEWWVECQPASFVEDTAGGTRVHTASSWRVITPPGTHIPGLTSTDGVLVDGIDDVLSIEGEVGTFPHPILGHDEFTVRRWVG